MNRIIRHKNLLQLAKNAGIITNMVQEYLQKPAEFKQTNINLGYPGTSVISPPNPVNKDGSVNIFFQFRGGTAQAFSKSNMNAVVVLADAGGAGGGPSRKAYGTPDFINKAVASILAQLKKQTGRDDIKLGKLGLGAFSGGYDPVHGILSGRDRLIKQPDYVGIFDGMHHGKPGTPNPQSMEPWRQLAEDAAAGKTTFIFAHSAVKPDNYASTTDSANWLLNQMDLSRQQIPQWHGTNQKPKTYAGKGSFHVFQLSDELAPYKVNGKSNVPGTSGRQHLDVLHAMPDYLPHWSA
jgi:hypothetical protein